MAHIAVGFLALTMLAPVAALPWLAPILLIPVLAAYSIARLRTTADRTGVTARAMFRSTTVDWDDIAGLKFVKSSWARAVRTDRSELALPAVTFATLPQLTAVSGGRVPNPYQV